MENSKDDSAKTVRKARFKRLSYLVYAVLLINFSFTMWMNIGYLNIPVLVAIWTLIGFSCLMIIYSVYNGNDIPMVKIVPVLSFLVALYVFFSVFVSLIPEFGTDEIAIDTYAAYLSLHGMDPYVNTNMLNVFTFTGFPQSLITPLATGGAVRYFSYPALSALLFIPAVAFNFPPYVILLAFNFAFFILLYFYYSKENLRENLPLLLIAMILDIEYSLYSAGGITDIVWVFFLGASYVYRKNWRVSGALYGLSIAFKQIPIVILPFFLYYLRKQEGYSTSRTFQFLLFSVISFTIPNLPYILMNPYAWFSNIVLVAYQPILGVGIGPSVLSFAGFIRIPTAIFEVGLIFTLIFFFYLYVVRFNQLKYAFFGFPVVIFLLNYRTLENYIVYWPLLILLMIPEVLKKPSPSETPRPTMKKKKYRFLGALQKLDTNRRLVNVMVVGIIIISAAASAGYVYTKSPAEKAPFEIVNITSYGDPYEIPNKVTSLTLLMNYTPPNDFPSKFNLYYRIFTNSEINNVNSLLWSENGPVSSGITHITIYPDTASDVLPYNVSFVIEAYYGNMTSFMSAEPIHNMTPVYFANPQLVYPTYTKSEPYLGWQMHSTGNSISTNYSYMPLGTYMNLEVKSNIGNWSTYYMQSKYNFSYLSSKGYHLSYSLGIGLSNVSTWISGTEGNSNSTLSNNISMREFVGVLLNFNAGTENMWIGYNSSITGTSFYFENRTTIVLETNTTNINFSLVKNIGIQYNWTFQDAKFAYIIGTAQGKGDYHAYFYNSYLFTD